MSNTNNQNNTSNHSLVNFASRFWQQSQQIIKGFSLVTVGIISYAFFSKFGSKKTPENISDKAPSNQLITSIKSNIEITNKNKISSTNVIDNVLPLIHTSTQVVIKETANTFKLNINYPSDDKNKRRENKTANFRGKLVSKRNSLSTPISIGVEFLVNNIVIYNQANPDVTANINTNSSTVVWSSEGQDGSLRGIFGQQLDIYGSKIHQNDLPINQITLNDQFEPVVGQFPNGNLIFAFTGVDAYGKGVFTRLFDGLASPLSDDTLVNTITEQDQNTPATCVLDNDNVVIAYSSFGGDGSYYGVLFQRFDGALKKLGSETLANVYTSGNQLNAALAKLANGNFVIGWEDQSGRIDWSTEIYLRIFSPTGAAITGEIRINTYTTDQQLGIKLACFSNGNCAAVWQSNGQDGSGYGIFGQLFDNVGNKVGSEFQINTFSLDDQISPSIFILTANRFIVTWQSNGQDGSGYGIYGQLFDSAGNKIGREFQVNAYIASNQITPKGVQLSNENIEIVWQSYNEDGSGNGIFGRILTPEITLFAYNSDIPKMYQEDTVYQFSDLIVNPMLDANTVNATLTLSNPSAGSLSIESSNNITASFDLARGVWQVQNAGIVDLNRIFEQLKFIPSTNYNSDFTIQVDLTDSNTNHTAYSNTLTMIGVPVNDVSLLTANQLALNQGDTITLGLNNINAADVDNALTDLSFKIDQLVQGQFENINNPGRGVTSFTYSQLANSEMRFIHDNTRFAPAYQISVSDGNLTTLPQSATIDFNARPELLNNQLSIEGGQTVILTQDNLKATDDHTAEGELTFMMSNITQGQFELVSAKGSAVTQFTQQQIIDNQVQFVHDNSNQAPGFKTSVNDGRISLSPIPVTVNFVGNNLLGENTLPLALGVSIGGAALLAGAGIGIWQGRKQQQLKREREQEPLANAVRTKLRVGNVDDFKSSQGRTYVNFINTLKNELINLGIETEQMLPDEINELAGFISDAIKETMKENGIKLKKTVTGAIELNTQTLQTYASTIAAKAQEFKNDHPGLNNSGMGLKTLNPVNAV